MSCTDIICFPGCVDAWNQKVIRGGAGAHFRIPIVSNVGWETLENYCAPDCNVILADCCLESNITESANVEKLKSLMGYELQQGEPQQDGYEVDNKGAKIYIDENYLNDSKLELYKKIGIESALYTDIEVDAKIEINIVIGGETEGLSGAAYRFAHKFHGKRAHIPMENELESLNCAVASGIILYDVRRKLTQSGVPSTEGLISRKVKNI